MLYPHSSPLNILPTSPNQFPSLCIAMAVPQLGVAPILLLDSAVNPPLAILDGKSPANVWLC